ncbi:MAG: GNAT family N-acetyltransferase [Rhodospirillaceae bacterium]
MSAEPPLSGSADILPLDPKGEAPRGQWIGEPDRFLGPEVPPGHLRTVVSYLEMTAPPPDFTAPVLPPDVTLTPAHAPDAQFYRSLYDGVGDDWLWGDRKRLAPEALEAILADPAVEVHVLSTSEPDGIGEALVGGSNPSERGSAQAEKMAPVGYFELDFRDCPAEQGGPVELAYFGLFPHAVGGGLGRALMASAIARCWQRPGVTRFWVHTCTLDHPRALGFYQAMGFTLYGQAVELVPDPRLTGVIARDRAPHVPLPE